MSFETQVPWSVVSESFPERDLTALVVSTSKLQSTTSIFMLHPYVEWVFTAPADILEDGLFSVGEKFTFTFNTSDLTGSVDLRVHDVKNGPSSGALFLGNNFTVILTSEWYYRQDEKSKALKGISSDLMYETLSEILDDEHLSIEPSADTARIQYRTFQTATEFLQSRVLPYTLGSNNLPYFLYSTDHGRTIGMSYDAMMKEAETFSFIEVESESEQPQERTIPTLAVSVQTNKTGKLWDLVQPSLYYMYRPTSTVKTPADDPLLHPYSFSTAETKRFSFVSAAQREKVVTGVVLDDSLRAYERIETEFIQNNAADILASHLVTCTCAMNLSLTPGRVGEIELQKVNVDEVSILKRPLLVISVTRLFQGTKSWMTVELADIGFSYDVERGVLPLFHTK